MGRSIRHTGPLTLTVICTILLLGSGHLAAQTGEYLELNDTSYFKAGEDDWNLVESVMKGHMGNVLFLLKRGADPDAKAEGGMTALMYAAEIGDTTLIKLLVLNGADLELTRVEKTTPLLVAVLNGNFDAAHYLLLKGANPDRRDDYGGTPLLYAAAMNDYQIADLLLFFGASDSIRDKKGNDPLMTAVYFGNMETSDVLLQNGFPPDRTDRKANTPMMIAAQQGLKEMIPLLLEYGASLEAVNSENHTALVHAVNFGQDSTAMLLVDSGANVNHRINSSRNVYDLAVKLNRRKVAKILKEKGAQATPRPDFSEIQISWGNSYRNNEHFMQNRVSWVDARYGYFGETGVDFRPVPRKIQVNRNDTLIHQYREQRIVWALGAGRQFSLLKDASGFEYGPYAAVYGLLSFPRYRGVSDSPAVEFNFVPSAGLFMKGKIAGIRAGVERYQFGTIYENPWKMNITLMIRINYQQATYDYKEINY